MGYRCVPLSEILYQNKYLASCMNKWMLCKTGKLELALRRTLPCQTEKAPLGYLEVRNTQQIDLQGKHHVTHL